MIAEDEAVVADGLKQLLEQLGHCVVGVAESAEDVVSDVLQHKPDVLLLDINLRNSDGLDAARILMKTCPVPIVVCTALADSELFTRAAKAGVSAYLVKPFRLSELVAAITLSCERSIYWCGDWPRTALTAATESNDITANERTAESYGLYADVVDCGIRSLIR